MEADAKRHDALVYAMYASQFGFVAHYPFMAPTLPHSVATVELFKRISRGRLQLGPNMMRPSAEERARARDSTLRFLQPATSAGDGGAADNLKEPEVDAFVQDVIRSHSLDHNSDLRLVMDYGVVDPESGHFLPGVDYDLVERALSKLDECVSTCSSVSPLVERIEYVHECPFAPNVFQTGGGATSSGCTTSECEPECVTVVEFKPACDRAVVHHKKRVRLWTHVCRPTPLANTAPPQPAATPTPATTPPQQEFGYAQQCFRDGRANTNECVLLAGHADMRMSILVEKDVTFDDTAVVLPKATKLVKYISFTFKDMGIEWKYTISLSWSGAFDEIAEYEMATGGIETADVQLQVEPVNLSDFFKTHRGISSSSVFQSVSLLLKASQLVIIPQDAVLLRPLVHTCMEERGNWMLKAVSHLASDRLAWSSRVA
jgi:hypothetical protein